MGLQRSFFKNFTPWLEGLLRCNYLSIFSIYFLLIISTCGLFLKPTKNKNPVIIAPSVAKAAAIPLTPPVLTVRGAVVLTVVFVVTVGVGVVVVFVVVVFVFVVTVGVGVVFVFVFVFVFGVFVVFVIGVFVVFVVFVFGVVFVVTVGVEFPTVKVIVVAVLTFPAISIWVTLIVCEPTLRAVVGVITQFPLAPTVAVPMVVVPSLTVIVLPATPVPEILDKVFATLDPVVGLVITGEFGAIMSLMTEAVASADLMFVVGLVWLTVTGTLLLSGRLETSTVSE